MEVNGRAQPLPTDQLVALMAARIYAARVANPNLLVSSVDVHGMRAVEEAYELYLYARRLVGKDDG